MKVFENIRVVDFSTFLAGPLLCRFLADLGARVIKVETEMPEPYRMLAIAFASQNRNKRSISVDMKKEQGKTIVTELVKKADIVVENARPGVMQRLGFDYDSCKKLKPDLIYVSASGFGTKGSLSELPGLDPIAAGLSGQMLSTCGPDNPPIYSRANIADVGVSGLGAYGTALALLARLKTGKGQKVESSLLHSAIAFGSHVFIDYRGIRRDYLNDREPKGTSATNRMYCAIDGKWFFVSCRSEEDWVNLCKATCLEGLVTDPRFADAEARRKNDGALAEMLSDCFGLAYAEGMISLLRSHNVPVAAALYETELYNDPQFVENDVFVWQEHPHIGKSQLVGFPVDCDNIENVLTSRAPLLGEQTQEILMELGYDQGKIDGLKADKVVFW